MSSDLTRATARGVMWSGLSQLVVVGTQFVVVAVLARLLTPEDFGIFTTVVIFMGLISLVNEFGLGAAIIQRRELDESHLSTTFWISLAAGMGFWLLATLASPSIAAFFHEDLVRPVLIVSSAAFVIGAFGVTHRALLARDLDFKKLAASEIGGSLAYGIVSISLASAHFGVWCLVWGGLSFSFTSVIILWATVHWKPKMHFSARSLRELFGFGGYVAGGRIANYAKANVDYLIVGRLLGASTLGIYSVAYRMITLPLTRISTMITRVMFPAFSQIQDEDERLRRGYLKVTSYISVVTFPMLAGLLTVAPEFVVVVFGDQWISAILPIQILCIAGMVKTVGTLVGSILRTKGRPDIELKWNTAELAVLTVAVIIGSRYGIVGVATGVSVVDVTGFLIIQRIAGSLFGLGLWEYLRSLYPAAVGSAVMAGCIAGYRQLGLGLINLNNLSLLASSVVLGAIVYLLAIWIVKPALLFELKDLVLQTVRPYYAGYGAT